VGEISHALFVLLLSKQQMRYLVPCLSLLRAIPVHY